MSTHGPCSGAGGLSGANGTGRNEHSIGSRITGIVPQAFVSDAAGKTCLFFGKVSGADEPSPHRLAGETALELQFCSRVPGAYYMQGLLGMGSP